MRILFYVVQILDGFETTSNNAKGLMPDYISNTGFSNVQELSYINTKIESYCYYKGLKMNSS
ncbi:hypothetical protein [Changchengzhania lutea]|uniref:hypothetical protein n=1 Tax=Changchengzhania lutea TaxID=2049305 RepID=UPI001C8F29A8|nr:hypothetical protein [Changchengzhania lutea]